eukprot:365327-Chlamydomonas_euryale.AAC.1
MAHVCVRSGHPSRSGYGPPGEVVKHTSARLCRLTQGMSRLVLSATLYGPHLAADAGADAANAADALSVSALEHMLAVLLKTILVTFREQHKGAMSGDGHSIPHCPPATLATDCQKARHTEGTI